MEADALWSKNASVKLSIKLVHKAFFSHTNLTQQELYQGVFFLGEERVGPVERRCQRRLLARGITWYSLHGLGLGIAYKVYGLGLMV